MLHKTEGHKVTIKSTKLGFFTVSITFAGQKRVGVMAMMLYACSVYEMNIYYAA